MKVIFTAAIPGVAHKGEVRNVKDGFFRNFLQPNQKAIRATDLLVKEWEERRKKILIERDALLANIEEMKRRIAGGAVQIAKKVTAKGTLYGGVKASELAKAVKEQMNLDIAAESFALPHLKAVGKYTVKVNLGEGAGADLPIEIVEKK